MEQENNKKIINNIIGSFIVKGGSLIVSLFTMPAYIRYFENNKVLGIWFTIVSMINWVLMFDLGLGNGLRNKLPGIFTAKEYLKAKEYISSTYYTTLMFVVTLGICSYCIIPNLNWNSILNINEELISDYILIKSVQIVFLGIMIQFVLKLITSILYAIQKAAIVNLLSLMSNIIILFMILILPSSTLEKNLIRISWVNIIAVNIPLLIISFILFSTELKRISPNIKFFRLEYAEQVLKIGIILLWLQFIFMIISSTNEFLISKLTGPEYVVEYQSYNKIFNAASSLFVLALTPIWSAVTKAESEKNYTWIKRLYKILLIFSGVIVIFEFLMVPFVQFIVNIWLGKNTINVIELYSIVFVISNGIFIVHNVNTSICNGLSYFKVQILWMTVAAIVDIPLACIFVNMTASWIGVILANILALLPYEILQPIFFKKCIQNK